MKMQMRWCFCIACYLAVSGLAGLADIPGPLYDYGEASTGLEIFAGTGIAFENCGGVDLVDLDEQGYVDRSHFLSLAVGLAGSWKVYRDAALEGKAFLAGPGEGYAVNWKQVLWRKKGESLALRPGFVYASGWKNVYRESSGLFFPIIWRDDLYGQSSVWELPVIYSTKIQVGSQNSALTPTLSLSARLAYARYKMKWISSETSEPTITRNLGGKSILLGSVSGNLRFHIGEVYATSELGVFFMPQENSRKSKTVVVLGISLGVPFDEQIFH